MAPAPPPVPVPASVTMRQARLTLLAHGLLGNVAAAINSLPEPAKSQAQIEWEYSNALERGTRLSQRLGLRWALIHPPWMRCLSRRRNYERATSSLQRARHDV